MQTDLFTGRRESAEKTHVVQTSSLYFIRFYHIAPTYKYQHTECILQ